MIQRFGSEEIRAVTESIKNASFLSGYTNKYLGGEAIQKFEEEFSKFHNCKFGIAVNSGTSALFVAQKALGVKPKDHVSIPCITFTATTSQVLACNAIPNFVDINKMSYCMDWNSKTKSKFAIPVHLLGHPCKREMIKEMKDNKIFVIEDCAQAMGAKDGGKVIGSMGDCSIFSFQETKHITTLGEGGMIITNNDELAEECRKIRNHGEYYKDDWKVGYNFRMTEAQAAFGRIQLKKLPHILKTFRKNAKYIFERLPDAIIPPHIEKSIEHSYLILGCKFDENKAHVNREKFLEKLTKNRKKILESESKSDIKGINVRPGKIISSGYRVVQYEIPLYRKFKPKRKCIVGEEFVKESLFIDIHRWRSKKEIDDELNIIEKTFTSIRQ
jgi:perosamine synthetase